MNGMEVQQEEQGFVFANNINDRPLDWENVLLHLTNNPHDIENAHVLSTIRRRLECDGAPFNVLQRCIEMYARQLSFSLFLCVARFPMLDRSIGGLLGKIFKGMETFVDAQMTYCIQKFNGNSTKPRTMATLIGEAMTLVFSFFDEFMANPQTGNYAVLRLVRQKYPKSILYIDAHEFTPLHGVCCSLNNAIFRYFIEWHLAESSDSEARGGLYMMNDSGITPMDTMIDTSQDIAPMFLVWLRSSGLLQTKDVKKWLLIHRAAHSSSISTLRLFIDLFPNGVLTEDSDGNLPIHLHLGLRYRPTRVFSEEDFDICRLLISQGMIYGGIDTIGGLFHEDPDEEHKCTLDSLLKEAGKPNEQRVWQMIDDCLEECGDYANAPIVHAAIGQRATVSNALFGEVVERYGVEHENNRGESPLLFAVKKGVPWNDGVSDILRRNRGALNDVDSDTELPLLLLAALNEEGDLNTIFELFRLSLDSLLHFV
jgi:ankyrin repeat protein